MFTFKRTCWIISALICCTVIAVPLYPLTWETTDDYVTATATEGGETYEYNSHTIFDGAALAGSLTYTNLAEDRKWVYNAHIFPQEAYGEWRAQCGDLFWSYHYENLQWSTEGGGNIWNHTDPWEWQRSQTAETWRRMPFGTLGMPEGGWRHKIVDHTDTEYGELWRFDMMGGYWNNNTLNTQWRFSYPTMSWSREGAVEEVWRLDPFLETYTCITEGIPTNNWRFLEKNRWVEEVSATEWRYLPPMSDGFTLLIAPRWQECSTEQIWTYNRDSKRWTSEDSEEEKCFPPLLPPLLIDQADAIFRTCYELGFYVFSTFTPPFHYVWHGDNKTLTIHENDYRLELVDSGITLGRGGYFGFSTSGYECSNGEKWGMSSFNSRFEQVFPNMSDGLETTDFVAYSSGLDTWTRTSPDWRGPSWQFDPGSGEWRAPGYPMAFTFDIDTQTWNSTNGKESWKYKKEGGVWVWWEQNSNTTWQYGTFPGPSSAYCWINQLSLHSWVPQATGTELTFRSLLDETTWYYSELDEEWRSTDLGFTDETRIIFPLLPPTMAGTGALLAALTTSDMVSTSNLSPEIGSINRMLAACEASQGTINAILEARDTLVGMARYNALLPQLSNVSINNRKMMAWLKEFRILNRPFNNLGMSVLVAREGEGFATWPLTQGFLPVSGQATFHVRFSRLSDGKSYGRVGFTRDPTTDASAHYTIDFGPQEYFGDTLFTIRILKEGEVVASRIVNPAPADGADFWISYDNGHVTILRGDPLAGVGSRDGKDVLLEHEIVDEEETKTNINYISFAAFDTDTIVFWESFLTSYFPVQAELVDAANQCKDLLRLAPLEEIWKHLKEELLALAQEDITMHQKRNRAQKISNILLGTDSVRKPNAEVNEVAASYYSPTTEPIINHQAASFISTYGCMGTAVIDGTGYLNYCRRTEALEDALSALLSANPALLSSEEKNTLIANTKEAINEIIGIAYTNIGNITTGAELMGGLPGNEDLSPFIDFFLEEAAFLLDLGQILSRLDPLVLERFEQQLSLYQTDQQQARTAVSASEEERQAARQAALAVLADRLAQGISTPFSTARAAAIVFFLNSKFDDITARLEAYLSRSGYEDYHTFPADDSPLKDQEVALTTLQTILDAIEPELAINGNTFYTNFESVNKKPATSSAEVYLHERLTADDVETVARQQKEIASGSAAYLKNTTIETSTDNHMLAQVRELVIPQVEKTETYSRLYLKDALVSLGTANLSQNSDHSLAVFGSVELSPEGSTIFHLNSNITLTGRNFLTPSVSFGSTPEAPARCIPSIPAGSRGKNEIIFHSDTERAITLTSGSTLDLTGFGQGAVPSGQRIVFSGKTVLILEPGSWTRFPYTTPNEEVYGLELVFKDDAQLIFQSLENYDTPRWTDALSGPDAVRAKMLGVCRLRFYENAQARIMRSALASIEADYVSPITRITVELNDASKWLVGDETTKGGGFQVGNSIDGGFDNQDLSHYPNNSTHERYGDPDNPFIPRPTYIDFSLSLKGSSATFMIGRQGFVGFGVGTIAKKGPINGAIPDKFTDPHAEEDNYSAWTVQTLSNVGNITLTLDQGTFWHHMVAQGSQEEASVLALGPQIPRASYRLFLNKSNRASIMGGGNTVFLRDQTTEPLPLSLWDSIAHLTGEQSDNGSFSLLAPAPLIMQRKQTDSTRPTFKKYGRAAIQEDGESYRFTGPVDEFFLACTLQKATGNKRYAIAYAQDAINKIAFVDRGSLIKTATLGTRSVKNRRGKYATPAEIAEQGYVRSTSTEPTANNLLL